MGKLPALDDMVEFLTEWGITAADLPLLQDHLPALKEQLELWRVRRADFAGMRSLAGPDLLRHIYQGCGWTCENELWRKGSADGSGLVYVSGIPFTDLIPLVQALGFSIALNGVDLTRSVGRAVLHHHVRLQFHQHDGTHTGHEMESALDAKPGAGKRAGLHLALALMVGFSGQVEAGKLYIFSADVFRREKRGHAYFPLLSRDGQGALHLGFWYAEYKRAGAYSVRIIKKEEKAQ